MELRPVLKCKEIVNSISTEETVYRKRRGRWVALDRGAVEYSRSKRKERKYANSTSKAPASPVEKKTGAM